jgi:hypothetical protein
MGTIIGGASVAPAYAGGRRGPHEPGQYAKRAPAPVYTRSGRAVLSRRAPGVVAPPVAYARPRRARAYNPPVYAPGTYNRGYYDPYYAPFPTGPAYTYDDYYGRRSDRGRDALTIVGTTAGGAVVGGLLGGKKGAIIGGVAGAVAGTVIANKTDGRRDYPRFPF